MLKTVSNGQSIHQYIPPDLKRMFYKNPARIHASHNGLDPYGFSTNGLVLYLPLWALKDSTFKSVDAIKHTCTATGTVWYPDSRLFNATTDVITIPATTVLDLGTSDWTWSFWLYKSAFANDDYFINKGAQLYAARATGVDGALRIYFEGDAAFNTNDAAYDEGVFTFLTIQRSGNDCVVRKNGAAFQTIANALTTGDQSTAAATLQIGGLGGGNGFDGYIGEGWIYTRFLSAGEDTRTYNCTIGGYQ